MYNFSPNRVLSYAVVVVVFIFFFFSFFLIHFFQFSTSISFYKKASESEIHMSIIMSLVSVGFLGVDLLPSLKMDDGSGGDMIPGVGCGGAVRYHLTHFSVVS